MHETFRTFIETLEPSFKKLIEMSPAKVTDLPRKMPESGVYLLSEGDRHCYAGRTDRLRQRIKEHGGLNHNSAPFAFFLARQETGKVRASYKSEGSRRELAADPVFREALIRARERIWAMDVRWVEEAEPTRQALLEIYVSVVLGTMNEFRNH